MNTTSDRRIDLGEYLFSHCPEPDEVQRDLEFETRELGLGKQISHYEGELLTMLTRLTGAREVVGVGVFTGYSSLCLARGMPPGGHLLSCEVSDEWTELATRYWQRAGVADRIELRIAPAAETLQRLPLDPYVDLAYIDADKVNHRLYYEELLLRLRPGGVMLLSDTLRGGHVLDPDCSDPDVRAVRELNDEVTQDPRVDSIMFGAGDGAMIARKRPHPPTS